MSKGKGLFGLLLGILTGTFLGVLFAPRKGEETRDRIKKARKAGGLGHEPVLEDMKKLGEEIKGVALGAYKETDLPAMIKNWREKLKSLSEEFVEDASDFHEKKVMPLRLELTKRKKLAEHEAKEISRKAKASTKVVKKAAKEVKRIFKKK